LEHGGDGARLGRETALFVALGGLERRIGRVGLVQGLALCFLGEGGGCD